MKIGILTSGGDCAGLNAVIRSIALSAWSQIESVELVGILEGYGGLLENRYLPMKRKYVDNILNLGGTILGTSRQPYKTISQPYKDGKTKLQIMCENYKKAGFDCLFCLGGAGTHRTAALLSSEGCSVIALPKTIDNDIYGTDITFGFQTAVEVAADALNRLRTTSDSHGRVMLAEIMGNKTGWLALHSAIAGGADIALIPEIPFSVETVCREISRLLSCGKRSVLISVAEGAVLKEEIPFKKSQRTFIRTQRGETTLTLHLAEEIQARTGVETRAAVLGHIQRGGNPCAYDRVLCTRLGEYAVSLLKQGKVGVTAAVRGGDITYNALSEIAGRYKQVDPNGAVVATARNIGINFGDESY